MAALCGLSLTTVQRIWRSHHLQPHRVRTFKRSTDPHFAVKLDDVVGLYMAPPRHTIVLSVDEKSQIQALDRTQPGLPLKPGKCATYTHDYVRNGTTTLFAALNTLEGTVFGRCAPRHRHQEFIAFLDQIEDAVPAGKVIHAVMDNYATHKHPEVVAWLAAREREGGQPERPFGVADKVRMELQRDKERFDREIARIVGCSPTTVGRLRREMGTWPRSLIQQLTVPPGRGLQVLARPTLVSMTAIASPRRRAVIGLTDCDDQRMRSTATPMASATLAQARSAVSADTPDLDARARQARSPRLKPADRGRGQQKGRSDRQIVVERHERKH